MEEKLVELVKNNPLLYDKSHKFAKRNDLREKAWIRIAAELGLTRVEVQHRWKTLRDRFHRERRAMCTPSEGKATSTKKKYKYYDIMLFLLDIPTAGNSAPTEVKESAASFLKEFSTKLEVDNEGNLSFEERVDYSPDNESHITSDVPGPSTTTTPASETRKRKRRPVRNDMLLDKTHEQMNKLLQSANKLIDGVTPVTAFFNSMALLVEANNLNFEHFSSLQIKVTNAVHEEIRKQQEENVVIQGI